MKKEILILFVPLFLLFHVNPVMAIPISYSFSISAQALTWTDSTNSDPLNIDGGTVDLSFALNSEATADQKYETDQVIGSHYYDVLGDLTMTQENGAIIYSEKVHGTVDVYDSYSQSTTVDSISWSVKDLNIGQNTYNLNTFAGFKSDFISTYPEYPSPFAFDNSDVFLHWLFIDKTGDDSYWAYGEDSETESHFASGAPVPEPASMLLLGAGLVGLAVAPRRRFFKK